MCRFMLPPPLTPEAEAERLWSSFSRKAVVLSLPSGKKRRVIKNKRSAENKKVLSPGCYTGTDTGRPAFRQPHYGQGGAGQVETDFPSSEITGTSLRS